MTFTITYMLGVDFNGFINIMSLQEFEHFYSMVSNQPGVISASYTQPVYLEPLFGGDPEHRVIT